MKICFAVCEYNPLHNGHLKHIEYIKNVIKPDLIGIIMSGNFTQRGEIAVMDKFTRAKHAILAGADIVFELPTVFATAPAEIFAKGSVKLLSEIKGTHLLCFGTESGEIDKLLATASALLVETKEFKRLYKEELKNGVTAIKAKVNALEKIGVENLDFELLKSPNNILGIEYTKAILSQKSKLEICPIIREGAGYNDDELYDGISSASAIRKAISVGKFKQTKSSLPSFVYEDLPKQLPSCDDLIYYSLLKNDKKDLKKILDCTEGLENRIKALLKNNLNLEELKDKLKTKRYTYSRISRILLSSLLGIEENFIKKCLTSELYLKVLAVNKDKMNVLGVVSNQLKIPLITQKKDVDKLSGTSLECFKIDVLANDIYNFVTKKITNEYEMKLI